MAELIDVWGEKLLVPKLKINDFTQAVKDNNIDLVSNLLYLSIIDINGVDDDFFTPLQLAAKHGHYKIVQLLLKNEADAHKSWYACEPQNYNDCSMYNPLQIAVHKNHIQIVKLLLSYKAPFGDYYDSYDSVFSLAASNNNIQILNMLYGACKETGELKSHLSDAFNFSVCEKKFESAKWLLERGCCVHQEGETLFKALGCIPLMELLLDYGASFEEEGFDEFRSYNIIQVAISRGELEVIKWMIEKKGVVLSEDWNLFHHAVDGEYRKKYSKFIEVVQFLEDQELILDKFDDKGYKPIHYAAKYCTPLEVNYFLSKGCDINEKTIREGYSVMHLAVRQQNVLMIDYLIEKGYNLDIQDSVGKTPIAYSCVDKSTFNAKSCDQIVKKLIIAGANLKDEISIIVNKKNSILDNCKLYEKVTVLTNLIHAFYSLDHSDTAKIMHSLEEAQSDIISYLHKKTFDRREQIKLCEEIEHFQSKAKLIELLKPQMKSFYEKISDIKYKLKENDDDILGTLIESISAGLVSESKLGNKIREFLPGPEKSMYDCLLTKKAFLSAEEKYKSRVATDPINFRIKKLKKANKELKLDSINKDITQLEGQLIGIKNTLVQPPSKKLYIDSDHIEAPDFQLFDKFLEIGIIGYGYQGDA